MKTIALTLLLALCLVFESRARLMQGWTYDMLNDHATLIAIATPVKVAETKELTALSNIEEVRGDGTYQPVMGKGIETSFKILSVLKGDRDLKQFVLHHFALTTRPAMNGPSLVSFKPGDNKQFLMFLQKETDGRYVAVSGQTDPLFSVIVIEQSLVLAK